MSPQIPKPEWILPSPLPEELATQGEIPPLIASVLFTRGMRSLQAMHEFLSPPDASNQPLIDLDRAAERLIVAAKRGERVAIFGDYDCDGICASAIVFEALRAIGVEPTVRLPKRSEGYGLNAAVIEALCAEGTHLLVAVDCGIQSHAEIARAKQLGTETIVVDHHTLGQNVPPALAVIHPQRILSGAPQPFCAAGLAWYLAHAIIARARESSMLQTPVQQDAWLDLAAIGTVADVVPLLGANRWLVQRGLDYINQKPRIGLRVLAQTASLAERAINAWHIGFILAPRLNAAGRLGSPMPAFELITTDDENVARARAATLELQYQERQRMTDQMIAIAEAQVAQMNSLPPLLFVVSEMFSAGMIGLIAQHLAKRYHRPAVAACIEGDQVRGSARSVPGFDVVNALAQLSPFLERYGGHPMAAGFSVHKNMLYAFKHRLISIAAGKQPESGWRQKIYIDAVIQDLRDLVNPPEILSEWLYKLEPHGAGNPRPVFAFYGATLDRVRASNEPEANTIGLTLRDNRQVVWNAIWRPQTSQTSEDWVAQHVDKPIDIAFSAVLSRSENMPMLLEVVDLQLSAGGERAENQEQGLHEACGGGYAGKCAPSPSIA